MYKNPTGIVPTNIAWTAALLDSVVEQLQCCYPFLQVATIGCSVLGRPIIQLSIGRGPCRVGYNAAHHANEWITTPVLLRFLEQYAAGLLRGESLGGAECIHLFDNYTLDVVPMVNPDAVDLVNGTLPEHSEAFRCAREIARQFPDIPFPSGWKANIQGVDLNLQYPAKWERAREIKFAQGFNRPAPRDYVGRKPLAEPEAVALYHRTMQADYQLTLAYHTQGKLIYWKFDDYEPEGSYALARRMEEVSGYEPQLTPYGSGSAGYKDWFIQQFNRPGYTIEAGVGVNPLPLSQFDEIYRDNLGILILGMTGLPAS